MSRRDILLSMTFAILSTLAIGALFVIRKKSFAQRAKRGSRAKFDAVLAKVPDMPPDEQDKL